MTAATGSSRNPGRPAALSPEQTAQAAALHDSGWSLRAFSSHYRVSKDSVARAISKYRGTHEEDTPMPSTDRWTTMP